MIKKTFIGLTMLLTGLLMNSVYAENKTVKQWSHHTFTLESKDSITLILPPGKPLWVSWVVVKKPSTKLPKGQQLTGSFNYVSEGPIFFKRNEEQCKERSLSIEAGYHDQCLMMLNSPAAPNESKLTFTNNTNIIVHFTPKYSVK